jgi:hypothetical protein
MGSLRTLHSSLLRNLTNILVIDLKTHLILKKARVLSFDKPYEHIIVRLEDWRNNSTKTFNIDKTSAKNAVRDIIKRKNLEDAVKKVVAISFNKNNKSILEVIVILK